MKNLLSLAAVLAATWQLSATAIRPPDGLVGWWREMPASGNNVQDAYPHGSNGTANLISSTTGKVGNGFLFDTDGDEILVSSGHTSLDVKSFTITAWLKTSNNNKCPVVEWADDANASCGVHLWVGTSDGAGSDPGKVHVNIIDEYGAYHWFSTQGAPIQNNTWYFVALTFENTATGEKPCKLYINNVEQTSLINDTDGDLPPFTGGWNPKTGNKLRIGHRYLYSGCGDANKSFKGVLDEIAIFDRVLSTGDLTAIYNAGTDGMVAPTGKAVVEKPNWSGSTFTFDVVAPNSSTIQVYSSTDGINWSTDGSSQTVGSTGVYTKSVTTTGIANKYYKAVNTSTGGGCANYAVGFATRTKPSGKRYMLAANAFERGYDNNLTDHIPSTASGTSVLVFDNPNSSTTTSRTYTSGAWSPTTAVSLAPGVPFWVDNSSSAVTLSFWGYLPDTTRTVQLPNASNRARASLAPSGLVSALGITPTQNDTIYLYDVTAQAYKSGSYVDSAWEGDYTTQPSVQPLEGFFFNANPARNWVQTLDVCP